MSAKDELVKGLGAPLVKMVMLGKKHIYPGQEVTVQVLIQGSLL